MAEARSVEVKKLDKKLNWFNYGDRALGKLYNGKMAYARREWRGVKDTFVDYLWWLRTWGDMIAFVMKAPLKITKGIFTYRWMASYLSTPAFIDRNTQGLRGIQLKMSHIAMGRLIKSSEDLIAMLFKYDQRLGADPEHSKKIVLFDEMTMIQLMAGFPNLIGLPYQLMPVFLVSEIDQLSCLHYIDAVESYGLPADVCPVPACEAGAAVVDAYPKLGCCFIASTMPCDGSTMTTSYQDRRFGVPTFPLSLPVRYDCEETVEMGARDIRECIRFIEEQTGETFDWDAYFTCVKRFNQETEMELAKWEINKTPYPQVTGPNLSLFREFAYQMEGGLSEVWLKTYQKLDKLVHKAYEKRTLCSREMRHRAIVWSCPAHYYANFSSWAENCWGINVLIDMEAMNYTVPLSENDPEEAYRDLAKLYERMTMRKHTNGGYPHILDELWRVVEEFHADMVFMYQHVACKTVVGLQGMFDEQARERGIHFIWIEHDLMDPRTVSRRDMRTKVNNYMINVLREEPLDPSLVEFEDDNTW